MGTEAPPGYPASAETPGRIGVIDLVRGVSIAAVLAHHDGLFFLGRPLEVAWLSAPWYSFWAKGWMGVQMFFVVSGFLISKRVDEGRGGLLAPDLRGFYVRRAARILPVLGIVCAVALAVLALSGPATPGVGAMLALPPRDTWVLFFLSVATFWSNWFFLLVASAPGLQWGLLWSLAIEEQFYLFYPLALRRLGRLRNLCLFLGFFMALSWACLIYLERRHLGGDGYQGVSFLGFGSIAWGCLLYVAHRRFREVLDAHRGLLTWTACAGLAVVVALYLRPQFKEDFWGRTWGASLFPLGLCVFLLGALRWRWTQTRWVRVLALPGRLSYGMYLWHPLVLAGLWPVLGRCGVLSGFALFFSSTLLLAYLSARFLESPLNRALRARFGG